MTRCYIKRTLAKGSYLERLRDVRKVKMDLLAEGFYSPYRSLHHTPLFDIDFESLLFSTVSKQSVRNFACGRGLLISLIARKFFEIG